MIRIKEDKSVKLSGITSLFISFDFNLEVINTIKTTDTYTYDKNTHVWEVPITALAYLLDELTYIDNIELQLYESDENKKYYYPTLLYKIPPFKHQLEGIEWGLNIEKGLLLDAPGAGKTTQIIYLAEELQAQKGLEHCLIICGVNALKANWKKEIRKFSNLSCRIIGEKINSKGKVTSASIKERVQELLSPIKDFFIIINIETIRSPEIINALKKGPNKLDMMVVDEVHKCLSGDTLITTDAGTLRIKDIVENKINCKIKSYNIETNMKEYKNIDITSYFKSDEAESLLQLEFLDDSNKIHKIKCTPDHPIYTLNRGYIRAEDLLESDEILINKITGEYKMFFPEDANTNLWEKVIK